MTTIGSRTTSFIPLSMRNATRTESGRRSMAEHRAQQHGIGRREGGAEDGCVRGPETEEQVSGDAR